MDQQVHYTEQLNTDKDQQAAGTAADTDQQVPEDLQAADTVADTVL